MMNPKQELYIIDFFSTVVNGPCIDCIGYLTVTNEDLPIHLLNYFSSIASSTSLTEKKKT